MKLCSPALYVSLCRVERTITVLALVRPAMVIGRYSLIATVRCSTLSCAM